MRAGSFLTSMLEQPAVQIVCDQNKISNKGLNKVLGTLLVKIDSRIRKANPIIAPLVAGLKPFQKYPNRQMGLMSL